jgi:hypothetical protein
MNLTRMLLGLAAAVSFALLTVAAPAPTPESQGPISDAMRLRGKVPSTAPPTSTRVVMSDDNTLVVDRVSMQYVAEQRKVVVEMDGKAVEQIVVVSRAVPVSYRVQVVAKNCKFFTVTKDGKLEALEAKKATAQLKKPLAVLTGDSAEVDPRHLEMVKAGTLYVILPPPAPQPIEPGAIGPGAAVPVPREELKKKE